MEDSWINKHKIDKKEKQRYKIISYENSLWIDLYKILLFLTCKVIEITRTFIYLHNIWMMWETLTHFHQSGFPKVEFKSLLVFIFHFLHW